MRWFLHALAAAWLLSSVCIADDASAPLLTGAGQTTCEFLGKPLNVYYAKPEGTTAATPVWFVMHGTNRNADDYRDNWIQLSRQHGALVVVPCFPEKEFPRYHTGEAFNKDGSPRPREQTLFHAIELIFRDIVRRERLSAERYCIFGHSAGGQFVHRMVLFSGENHIQLAVAANAGWYTLPTRDVAAPYGLDGTGISDDQIRSSLQQPLCILLGDADIDPMHKYLNRSAGANAQGPHRLARGRNFFSQAQRSAARLNVPLQWTLKTVPGVAHSNDEMAPPAAELMARASFQEPAPLK